MHREKDKDFRLHGGNLEQAQTEFGHNFSDWLDLSTGINPIPYPLPSLAPETWQRLPSSSAEIGLLQAARNYYSLAEQADICACPGTQAAIQQLPRLIPRTEIAVVSPTYNEHLACWQQAGHHVQEIPDIFHVSAKTSIVILVHPNNPDGRIYEKRDLLDLAKTLKSRNGWLILDEAFADVMPEVSLMPDLPQDGILILRSFGKFFGLAGLRLGFVAGPSEFIDCIRLELGPWAVSSIALEVGRYALKDREWIAQTQNQLAQSAVRLSTALIGAGLEIIGGTNLFSLIESPQASALFRQLCENAILVRHFPDRPEQLRFGLPGTETDWLRLEKNLKGWANR